MIHGLYKYRNWLEGETSGVWNEMLQRNTDGLLEGQSHQQDCQMHNSILDKAGGAETIRVHLQDRRRYERLVVQ